MDGARGLPGLACLLCRDVARIGVDVCVIKLFGHGKLADRRESFCGGGWRHRTRFHRTCHRRRTACQAGSRQEISSIDQRSRCLYCRPRRSGLLDGPLVTSCRTPTFGTIARDCQAWFKNSCFRVCKRRSKTVARRRSKIAALMDSLVTSCTRWTVSSARGRLAIRRER
jgi:hypothetical protein